MNKLFGLDRVIYKFKKLNPHINTAELRNDIIVEKSDKDGFTLLPINGKINWSNKKIKKIPNIAGKLKIKGDLDLSNNEIVKLPNEFGNIQVSGTLNLGYNRIYELGNNFGNITIGSHLYLNNNSISSLPTNFNEISCKVLWINNNFLPNSILSYYFKKIISNDKNSDKYKTNIGGRVYWNNQYD